MEAKYDYLIVGTGLFAAVFCLSCKETRKEMPDDR
jgi:hypothetical protein